MIDINTLTDSEFQALPLVVEGESKEVRYAGGGLVVIRFKPTIYSFTSNRTGVVEGSDVLRLRASQFFLEPLRLAGIRHAYHQVNDRFVLADLILQPKTELVPNPFRPTDLPADVLEKLPVAPPIEVIVKRYHTGTSKHRYFGMTGHPVRLSHALYGEMTFGADGAYPQAVVRFDWRNPFEHPTTGKQLADEILPDTVADWYIDVARARSTAMRVFNALSDYLEARDIVIYDICLFITEDGETVFGELSQDCGRYRHYDLGELDKDVWRAGGSSEMVLDKWKLLLTLLERKGVTP